MTEPINPLAYEALPAHLRKGLRGYFEYGTETGSFLRAALENDLTKAVLHADDDSMDGIFHLARFLVNEAPEEAWGSPAKVEAWIAKHAAAIREAKG